MDAEASVLWCAKPHQGPTYLISRWQAFAASQSIR